MDTSDDDFEENMRCAAEFVLEHDLVSGPAEGIAKQVIGKGWDSLSSRQVDIFEAFVIPAATRECERCGCEIPFCELSLGGDLCSWCAHQVDKGN